MSESLESNYQKFVRLHQDRVKQSAVLDNLLDALIKEYSDLLRTSKDTFLPKLRQNVMKVSWKLFVTYSELSKIDPNLTFQAFIPTRLTSQPDSLAPVMVFPPRYDYQKVEEVFKALGFDGNFISADLDTVRRIYPYHTN